jgi:hypothetical protein
MMASPYITGQLFMRHVGEKDGRTLVMVVGILAVPPDKVWEDGHQYAVLGFSPTSLTVDPMTHIDRKAETQGMNADDILTTPFWRV